MGEQESGYVIFHNRLGRYWAKRLQWVRDLAAAKVYPTQQAAELTCGRLNRQYSEPMVQCLPLSEARARQGDDR